MDDLQTINNIVEQSIKDSSYVSVLISSGVFISYTLINKVIEFFKAKDRNKPMVEMAKAIKEVSENVVKLNQVLSKTLQDVETKEIGRTTNIISVGFNSFKSNVINECTDIIIHNNIDKNEELIKQNLYKIISTEYYKLYSIFSAYEIDGINVATKIKEEWIDEINRECISIIYNGQDVINRLRQINNKLTLTANEHAIYVNNKVFNH